MQHPHQWSALPQQRFNLLLLLLLHGIRWTTALDTHLEASTLYDWGYYGGYPRLSYESFGAQSPLPNLVQTSRRCDDGYLFVEPRGHFVDTPGPVILDTNGNLVWMQTRWGQVMDVKVQKFQGKDYITFWHGSDSGTFGTGQYVMVRQTIGNPFQNSTNIIVLDSSMSPTKSSRRSPLSAITMAISTSFELLKTAPL